MKKKAIKISIVCILIFSFVGVSVISAISMTIYAFANKKGTYINVGEEMQGLPPILTEEMVIGAIKSQEKYKVPASVTLAQIIQESSGSHPGHLSGLAYECKNLFGMKGEGPAGSKKYKTGEYTNGGNHYVVYAKFRKYHNFLESIDDHGKLLSNSRYKAYTADAKTSDEFARAIHKAGYATDPNYAQTLIILMKKYDLYKFDSMTEEGFKDFIEGDGKFTGKFRWPLQIKGHITSYFGHRDSPTAGASSFHQGIDIAAPGGSDILAAEGGKVIHAGFLGNAGNAIMIEHDNGLVTQYFHIKENGIKVKKGQKVSKGQIIAKVGSTGVSTGNHLHFGVKYKGKLVDPLKYVKQPN